MSFTPTVLWATWHPLQFPSFFFSGVKVLEKMRPVDRKLKYQIDKLIRMAKIGVAGEFCSMPLCLYFTEFFSVAFLSFCTLYLFVTVSQVIGMETTSEMP